jgi:sulfite exporter TauE/SafE
MGSLLLEGWFLGLAIGGMCLFSCGPVYLPVLLSEERKLLDSFLTLLEISLGRLVAYALFGALAGALGAVISDEVRGWLAVLSFGTLGIYLLLYFLSGTRVPFGALLNLPRGRIRRPVIVGFLSGVSVCPPFALALSRAFASGGVLPGIGFFVAFFLGTSVYLLPFVPLSLLSGSRIARILARVGGMSVGAWFLYKGIQGLWRLLG